MVRARPFTFGRTNGFQRPRHTKQSAHPAILMTFLWSPLSATKFQSGGMLILFEEFSSLLMLKPSLAIPLVTHYRKTSLFGWGARGGSSLSGVHIMWPSQLLRHVKKAKALVATLGPNFGKRCGISTFLQRFAFLHGGLV